MTKMIVQIKNYALFSYPAYLEFDKEISKPENAIYDVGEVVVIDTDEGLMIGVVLGCIDQTCDDLRTDMCGMVSMEKIRSAVIEDFSIPGIHFLPRLLAECKKIK